MTSTSLVLPYGLIVGAYLLGSISFAVLISRVFRLPDPHSYGSGNPGATNVLRTGNKLAAFLTLLGDGLKGWLAVFLAQQASVWANLPAGVVAGVALSVFLGHLFPLFHRFSGGKGVATAAGILLALEPTMGLSVIAIWLSVVLIFRISALAALVAAISSPILAFWFWGGQPQTIVTVLIAAGLILRHHQNIAQLMQKLKH